MADSDSENEGILNNIQRLVIRPPGHTGKAKKGHICFDGGFETESEVTEGVREGGDEMKLAV